MKARFIATKPDQYQGFKFYPNTIYDIRHIKLDVIDAVNNYMNHDDWIWLEISQLNHKVIIPYTLEGLLKHWRSV